MVSLYGCNVLFLQLDTCLCEWPNNPFEKSDTLLICQVENIYVAGIERNKKCL